MAQINPFFTTFYHLYIRPWSSSSSYFTLIREKRKEAKPEAILESFLLLHVLLAKETKDRQFVRDRKVIPAASPSINDFSAIAIIV